MADDVWAVLDELNEKTWYPIRILERVENILLEQLVRLGGDDDNENSNEL